jgi:hypothetical protein
LRDRLKYLSIEKVIQINETFVEFIFDLADHLTRAGGSWLDRQSGELLDDRK